MSTLRPLLHVGYHKTATAWFQKQLFPSHPGFHPGLDREEIRRTFLAPHPLTWDAAGARAALEPALAEAEELDRALVLSEEELGGNPHAGALQMGTLARRLHETLPEARVWFAVREQRSMLVSNFQQYVQVGGTASLPRYLAGNEGVRLPGFRPETLEYDRAVRFYQDVFGPENVLVTLFEDFKEDPQGVADRVSDFAEVERFDLGDLAGTRKNPSLSGASTFILRKLNRRFRTPDLHNYPTIALPGQLKLVHGVLLMDRALGLRRGGRLGAQVEAWCGDRFAASNQRLAELLGEDLAARGYHL